MARSSAARVGLDSIIDVHTHFMPERLLAAVLGLLRRGRAADRPAVADHLPRGRADAGVDAAGVRRGGVHRAALPAQAGHGPVAQRMGRGLRRPDAGLPAQRHVLRRAVGRRRRPPRDRAGRAGVQVPSPGRRLRPERPGARRGLGAAGGGGRPGRDALRLRSGGRPLHRARRRSRGCWPGTRRCGWWSRTSACPSTASSWPWPSATRACCSTRRWRSRRSSTTPAPPSRRPNCRGCVTSVTACYSARTSLISRTPTQMRLKRSNGPGSARTGCARSAMTMPPHCSKFSVEAVRRVTFRLVGLAPGPVRVSVVGPSAGAGIGYHVRLISNSDSQYCV